MAHKYDPKHIDRLLSEERRSDIAPLKLLKDAGLKEGDLFADIGCGPGFFTVPAAEAVGKTGRVFAVDFQEEMLTELKKRTPPENVIPLKSTESHIPLAEATVDFALLAYMLHETQDKTAFLKDVKRILKNKSTVLIVDWKKIKEEHGPPIEERLTEDEVSSFLKDAGFENIKAMSLNQSHYKIAAIKV